MYVSVVYPLLDKRWPSVLNEVTEGVLLNFATRLGKKIVVFVELTTKLKEERNKKRYNHTNISLGFLYASSDYIECYSSYQVYIILIIILLRIM